MQFPISVATAVLGGVLLAPSSTHALPPAALPIPVPGHVAKDEKTDLAELKRQVEDANRKLATISEQLKVLTELLNGKRDKDGYPLPSDRGLVEEVKDLKNKLAAIERDLAAFRSQTSSLRPVTPINPSVDPKAGKGTIRVVNQYPVQISILVNGVPHKVAPSTTLDVDVPAGEFTYQLLEAGATSTRSIIKEKETVTLRIK